MLFTLKSGLTTVATASQTVDITPNVAANILVTLNGSTVCKPGGCNFTVAAGGTATLFLQVSDTYGNLVTTNQTDSMTATLAPNAAPPNDDQGTLTEGAQTTGADTNGSVFVDFTLSSGSATVTYTAGSSALSGKSGVIQIDDNTGGWGSSAGSIVITIQ